MIQIHHSHSRLDADGVRLRCENCHSQQSLDSEDHGALGRACPAIGHGGDQWLLHVSRDSVQALQALQQFQDQRPLPAHGRGVPARGLAQCVRELVQEWFR